MADNLSNMIEDPLTGEVAATNTVGLNTLLDFLKSFLTPPVGTTTPPPSTIADALRMSYDPRRTMLNVPSKPTLPTPLPIPPSSVQVPTTGPVVGPSSTLPRPLPGPPTQTTPSIGTPPTPSMVPTIPIEVPTEPEVTAPPFMAPEASKEVDFKAEIQKILGGIPDTVKGVVGKEPEDIRAKLSNAPWHKQLMAGLFAGAAGKDLDDVLDKTQKRIDDKFKQDFDMAKSKLGTKVQLETKQLEIMMEKDKEKRESYSKLWSTLGEANPERYLNDPEWWAMGMKANGIGETEIRKWVQSQYNPKTGKYEGLYMSKDKRDWESKKFLIKQLSKEIPGYSQETYFQMAYGNWPDLLKKKEEQLKLEHGTASPERKRQIEKTLYDFNKLKDIVPPDVYTELDRLSPSIGKETVDKLKRIMMLKERIGPELTTHVLDIEGKKEIAALGREAKQPNEAMIKQANLNITMGDPISQVIISMKPGYRMGLNTGNKDIVTSFNTDVETYNTLIDTVRANQTAKKKTPLPTGSNQMLSSFYSTQKRYIRNRGYGEVASTLGDFNDVNLLLADEVIRWTMQGVPPDVILEAIRKIRKK